MKIADIPMTVEAIKEAVGGRYEITFMTDIHCVIHSVDATWPSAEAICDMFGMTFYGNVILFEVKKDKTLVPMDRIDLELAKVFVKPPYYYCENEYNI